MAERVPDVDAVEDTDKDTGKFWHVSADMSVVLT
jgi:hypothetical protein